MVREEQVHLIPYSIVSEHTPNAASRVLRCRFLSELMMTLYVAARVSNRFARPKRAGTCPAAILIAEPVINPETAGWGTEVISLLQQKGGEIAH